MDCITLSRDIDIVEKNQVAEKENIFASRIEAISEKSIFISQPFKRECYWQVLQADVGKIISVCIADKRCFYSFDSQIMGISTDSPELWELSMPTDVRRMQRRQHVRLSIILDVTIKFIDTNKNAITTFTKDISAGGLQIIMEELPPENSNIKIFLPLNKEITIEAKGEIIRVILPEKMRKRVAIAIKFSDITKEEQEQLMKFIFNKEVELRQKEREIFGKNLRLFY